MATRKGYVDFYFKRPGRRDLDNINNTSASDAHGAVAGRVTAPGSIVGTFYLNAFYCRGCRIGAE
jgi:hypothetical protein